MIKYKPPYIVTDIRVLTVLPTSLVALHSYKASCWNPTFFMIRLGKSRVDPVKSVEFPPL